MRAVSARRGAAANVGLIGSRSSLMKCGRAGGSEADASPFTTARRALGGWVETRRGSVLGGKCRCDRDTTHQASYDPMVYQSHKGTITGT
jgi:hypothetical protein